MSDGILPSNRRIRSRDMMSGATQEQELLMSQLLIPDVDEATLGRLRERAIRHGRTLEGEVKTILSEAAPPAVSNQWAGINAMREQLAASGRIFPDSTDSIREDRSR
jgi:antitoxin FitA